MGTCALFDYNNLCFRMFFAGDVGIRTPVPDISLWKYLVINSILETLMRFKVIDEVVIAVDDRNSWRKSYFSRYKESRKVKRDKADDVDWGNLFNVLESFRRELKHHFPFKVIKVRGAEADDVIAAVVKNIDSKSIIHSNDEDYLQLSSSMVRIFNPSKNKFTTIDNPKEFLIQKCLTGQGKDDIFNVKTPNEYGRTIGTEGKRKPGLGPKTAEKIMNEGYQKWLDKHEKIKCVDIETNYNENFKRNKVLIDFNMIPQTIIGRILREYDGQNYPPIENMYKFFVNNGMVSLIDEYTKIENRVVRLY